MTLVTPGGSYLNLKTIEKVGHDTYLVSEAH